MILVLFTFNVMSVKVNRQPSKLIKSLKAFQILNTLPYILLKHIHHSSFTYNVHSAFTEQSKIHFQAMIKYGIWIILAVVLRERAAQLGMLNCTKLFTVRSVRKNVLPCIWKYLTTPNNFSCTKLWTDRHILHNGNKTFFFPACDVTSSESGSDVKERSQNITSTDHRHFLPIQSAVVTCQGRIWVQIGLKIWSTFC